MGRTNANDKKIRTMWHQGNSVEKIAESVGISKVIVEKSLKNGGVKMEARKEKEKKNLPSSEIKETVPVINVNEEPIKYSSSYKNVSEDNLEIIITELTSNSKFNMTKISKETGVNVTIIKKIRDDLGIGKKFTKGKKNIENVVDNKESEKANQTEEIIEEKDSEKLTDIIDAINSEDNTIMISPKKYDSIIRVGLIKDRHDMPPFIKEYVFDSIPDMFNYKMMDSIASEFILNNIGIRNGMACKKLEIYMTGLTAAGNSIVGMCAKYKVNLTLWHYNNDTGNYESQPIFTNFPVCTDNDIKFKDIEQMYLHNMTEKYMLQNPFFVVEKRIETPESKLRFCFKIVNLFKDRNNAMKYYINNMIDDSNENVRYSIYYAKIDCGELKTLNFIARTYTTEV